MEFNPPLQSGRFIRRYKRFFAEIAGAHEDEPLLAHVPNTGTLKGCVEIPAPCLFTRHDDPKRKLPLTLQMIKTPTSWVGVNTGIAPQLVWEAWSNGKIWREYDCAQREVKVSAHSRIDLVLWNSQGSHAKSAKLGMAQMKDSAHPLHIVEIKNVTYANGKHALFPDCVSVRAQKHLRELMAAVQSGHRAEIVFVVQREDCTRFRAAHECDPAYARILKEAHQNGVEISVYSCRFGPQSIELTEKRLPVDMEA